MKNLLISFILVAVMATTAMAFAPQSNNTRIWVNAVNNTWGTITCRGTLKGRTASGHVISEWFNFTLPPGGWFEPYIFTSRSNPFVKASGGINCGW